MNHSLSRRHIKDFPQIAIFSFDHIGLTVNLEGRYENEPLQLIEQLTERMLPESRRELSLDIGAKIGNHSLLFSRSFKKVFAFEPNPITFEILKFNSKFASEEKNNVPLNYGLSDKDGLLAFLVNASNIGSSRIISEDDERGKSGISDVKVKSADSIPELLEEKISLIKVDVEKHEIYALKGAENLILKNKPIIIFEQSESEIDNGSSPTISYLKSLDYNFATIEKNFYFGEQFYLKILSFILRSAFGFKLRLVSKTSFKKKFYSMIVALPNSHKMPSIF
ncbi:FkbM family methyltransferase [Marinobacter sp. LV10R520-4]|uniref:FkbM family methyltransferase n=1 Tax=Marinobacter sp. LV10R520-4 TaxID=1761796 RepID=UPI000C017961|nr:FkbM family methyltransferase [Marinobacter sp. LV10R520-4]PFG51197.1 FkbM family methyltransferase [Marinobacter sp. LV10R520-4]